MASRNPAKERARRMRARLRAKGIDVPRAAVGRGPGAYTQRFLGVDGEGGTVDGKHAYTLLVAAGKNHAVHTHNGGQPLSTTDCLDFILSLPKQRVLVTFYFNYDVTMILKDLDVDTLRYLIRRDDRTNHHGKIRPVVWGDYMLDWIPGKLFKVAKGKASRVLYDTSGFFQSSFVSALEGWKIGDEEERAFIERMKAERSDFTGAVTDEVISYASMECALLCKLMDGVYRESETLGFHLRTFSGAGSLANAILDKWGVGDMRGELPPPVDRAAWTAYYGGRFEAAAIGEVPGPIYEYDINSAYPAAMADLPCLACGEWHHVEGTAVDAGIVRREPPSSELRLFHVEWNITADDLAGIDYFPEWLCLPWRSESGSICYPADGSGWYWWPELNRMDSIFPRCYRVREMWRYSTECNHKPFGLVPTLYQHRKELKAIGHMGEKVIKLGINSLYGKTAQKVGARKFASPVWAGMITSRTRAQLMDAARVTHDDGMPAVVMVATDAVYSRQSMLGVLPLGNELGEWEGHIHDNMLIVQPGLYALNVGTKQATIRKTRGIRKTSFSADQVLRVWREHGMHGSFSVPVTSFVGLRRGLVSTQYEPGQWVEESRTISFSPRIKRLPVVIPNAKGIAFLSGLASTGNLAPSAIYASGLLSTEEMERRMMMADDDSTPDPEWIPGHIMGFAHPDFKT